MPKIANHFARRLFTATSGPSPVIPDQAPAPPAQVPAMPAQAPEGRREPVEEFLTPRFRWKAPSVTLKEQAFKLPKEIKNSRP